MSILWCFRTARKAVPGAARSPPWRRVVREPGTARSNRWTTAAWMIPARGSRSSSPSRAQLPEAPCWWARAWAAMCAAAAAARLRPRGLFLLAPAFYMPGYEDYTPQDVRCPTAIVHGWHDDIVPVENSIRWAREHQCGAARAQLGSSAGGSNRSDLCAAARFSAPSSWRGLSRG